MSRFIEDRHDRSTGRGPLFDELGAYPCVRHPEARRGISVDPVTICRWEIVQSFFMEVP
ncbi:hypothetical protein BH23CHL2_BH23CHL2_31020 [soil metagenome]